MSWSFCLYCCFASLSQLCHWCIHGHRRLACFWMNTQITVELTSSDGVMPLISLLCNWYTASIENGNGRRLLNLRKNLNFPEWFLSFPPRQHAIKMPLRNGWTNPRLICVDSIIYVIFLLLTKKGNFTFGCSLLVHVVQKKAARD